MVSTKARLLGKIAQKIPPANKINVTNDDAVWAFVHFLVSVSPEQMLQDETRKNNDVDSTIRRFFNSVKSKKEYLLFKNINKKDLIFTVDEAATLVFLRWLDMIHDKTIDMTFKRFLDASKDLNSLGGAVKKLVKDRFATITNLPPYVQRILEACVSPTGKADNIKIVVGPNETMRFKDAKEKHSRNTSARRRGGGKPLNFDFSAKSGAYESNLKMKLSEIYGFLEPTTIDVRSDIFKRELNNSNSNFVPDTITMSIDQEGEPQQLSELINKNDKVHTRWNIPAILDPGHKMLRRFGLAQDLMVLLGISNTRTEMTSTYVIEPLTFNFKVLNPGGGAIPWMTLRWRINKPTESNPRSFTMEHAVYGGGNNSIKNVTPVTKREAGFNQNINNISTNKKKAAKHYGDFAQILQSIVSTRESQAAIVRLVRNGNVRSTKRCKAMGTGDGVLVAIYGLMATVFHRNKGGTHTNLNTRAKIALFLDVPDFKNKIYFYNQGFTRDPNVPMRNAVGGTNVARASPAFSNRSRNQGPARTSVTGNSNLGAAFANKNSVSSEIVKLLTKNNNTAKTNTVSNKALNVYGKIANYRKGGAISKIYTSYNKLPSKAAKLNYAKKLFNVKNKNDFMNWEQNLNMASKQSTPAASNASGVSPASTNYATALSRPKTNGNTNNTASSAPRPSRNGQLGGTNRARNTNTPRLKSFINNIKSKGNISINNNSSNERKLAAVIRARAKGRGISLNGLINNSVARTILNRLTAGNQGTKMFVSNSDISNLFPNSRKRPRPNNNGNSPQPKRRKPLI